VFGLVRTFGGTEQLAWALQWAMSGAVFVGVIALWRSRAEYTLKAASLAAGTLLLTPYLFLYDMMVLAIPLALLIRLGLQGGFRPGELASLACAMALLIAFPFSEVPLGLGATLIVAALIVRRVVSPSAEKRLLTREMPALG
jgi:arabinofuranan 3-O-arabinosyltransferase